MRLHGFYKLKRVRDRHPEHDSEDTIIEYYSTSDDDEFENEKHIASGYWKRVLRHTWDLFVFFSIAIFTFYTLHIPQKIWRSPMLSALRNATLP